MRIVEPAVVDVEPDPQLGLRPAGNAERLQHQPQFVEETLDDRASTRNGERLPTDRRGRFHDVIE
jgi:hypothetical protein